MSVRFSTVNVLITQLHTEIFYKLKTGQNEELLSLPHRWQNDHYQLLSILKIVSGKLNFVHRLLNHHSNYHMVLHDLTLTYNGSAKIRFLLGDKLIQSYAWPSKDTIEENLKKTDNFYIDFSCIKQVPYISKFCEVRLQKAHM